MESSIKVIKIAFTEEREETVKSAVGRGLENVGALDRLEDSAHGGGIGDGISTRLGEDEAKVVVAEGFEVLLGNGFKNLILQKRFGGNGHIVDADVTIVVSLELLLLDNSETHEDGASRAIRHSEKLKH